MYAGFDRAPEQELAATLRDPNGPGARPLQPLHNRYKTCCAYIEDTFRIVCPLIVNIGAGWPAYTDRMLLYFDHETEQLCIRLT